MYRHILVPTDGSKLAHRGVTHAFFLAKSVGAKVTALFVTQPFDVFDVRESQIYVLPKEIAAHNKRVKEHAAKLLDRVAREAKKAGVRCDTVQVSRDLVHDAIVRTAKNRQCDLIVMASHGRGGIAGLLLGSVTTKVLSHTRIPVLVCR